jgi:hypothetical protein
MENLPGVIYVGSTYIFLFIFMPEITSSLRGDFELRHLSNDKNG